MFSHSPVCSEYVLQLVRLKHVRLVQLSPLHREVDLVHAVPLLPPGLPESPVGLPDHNDAVAVMDAVGDVGEHQPVCVVSLERVVPVQHPGLLLPLVHDRGHMQLLGCHRHGAGAQLGQLLVRDQPEKNNGTLNLGDST